MSPVIAAPSDVKTVGWMSVWPMRTARIESGISPTPSSV